MKKVREGFSVEACYSTCHARTRTGEVGEEQEGKEVRYKAREEGGVEGQCK